MQPKCMGCSMNGSNIAPDGERRRGGTFRAVSLLIFDQPPCITEVSYTVQCQQACEVQVASFF